MCYSCDFQKRNGKRCGKKPYMEVYFNEGWSYLCFWHYILDRITVNGNGYCRPDTQREKLESLSLDLFDIKIEIERIKEALNIIDEEEDDKNKGYE